jgi:hypothetical protein
MREILSPLAWFLCIVGSTEYIGWKVTSSVDIPVRPNVTMPATWERRYYRRGATSGWEVAVIRRGVRPKEWMVVAPDGGVFGLELSHRASCRTSPDGFATPIDFTPLPVLSDERRTQIMETANTQVERGRVTALPLYGGSGNVGVRLRRWASVVATLPALSASWVRWCLRSRARFSALGIVSFFLYEGLETAGLFDRIQRGYQAISHTYLHVRGTIVEHYEGISEWVHFSEDLLDGVRTVIEPWRLVAYMFCALVLMWACREISAEDPLSRTSSPGTSPVESPVDTPPRSPRSEVVDSGMKAISEGFLRQQELLNRLAESHIKLEQRISEVVDGRRAEVLLREAEGAPSGSVLDEIKNRLASFEEVLRMDRSPLAAPKPTSGPAVVRSESPALAEPPSGHGPAHASSGHEHAHGPSGHDVAMSPLEVPHVKPSDPARGAAASSGQSSDLAKVISKLKKSVETPHEIFVKCLEGYVAEDPDDWSRYFPVGYRQRVAPTFLAEVYSQGMTAKAWAKRFVNDRQLGEFGEARDLIPAMAAIDSLILQDRAVNIINSVALERLAKKSYAIYQSCQHVKSEKDWRKPKDAKKDWRSKVDFVLWRRLDPSKLQDDEMTFVNRQVEDEVRTEMDREASLLKARQKLEERLGSDAL